MDDPSIDRESMRSPSRSPEASQQSNNDEKPAEKSVPNDGSESPARCPICLATPENDAKSDSCSHNFCFSCLKEWCKVKAECPLCKMPIHSIFYNIKSDSEYDEYKVKVPKPENKYNVFPFPEFSFNLWQSTLRREFFRRRQQSDMAIESASDVCSIRQRRMYYWNKSKVLHVDTRNRVRECSANFFRENPSQVHRLTPWLRRELTVLYGARNKLLIDHLFKKIINVIPHTDINSRQFKNMISDYMLEYTDQFIHEFLSFARSPYNVLQYDRAANYGINGDQRSQQSGTAPPPRKHRSYQYCAAGHSRWDSSPDSLPLGASAQSMMLSQTTWSEEPSQSPILPGLVVDRLTAGLPGQQVSHPPNDDAYMSSNGIGLGFNMNPLLPYSGFYDPPTLSHRWISRDPHRDIGAPLQLQTMDLYRHGGSSARQYQSMERRRQHIGDFQRSMSNMQRKNAVGMSIHDFPAENIPTIVISDSSEEETAGTSSKKSNTIHYKPALNQSKVNRTRFDDDTQIQVKEEASRPHRDSSTTDVSDSDDGNSSSGIVFVRYIKPPHLRTPDAFIDLSSTDEDTPGPSNKYTAVINPNNSASHCTSFSDTDNRNSRIIQNDVLEKTKEFLGRARHASRVSANQNNIETNVNLLSLITPPTDASRTVEEFDQVIYPSRANIVILPSLNDDGDDVCNRDSVNSNPSDSTPKKIFQKGKVSFNFPASKRLYSSSDSEIDVDYVEEMSICTNRTGSQDDTRTDDLHSNNANEVMTLKSVTSIPENQASPVEQNHENPHHCRIDSTSDRGQRSSENIGCNERERKHRKRRQSRHSESNHSIKPAHSRRHKKRKRRRRSSQSSSVEFVNEAR